MAGIIVDIDGTLLNGASPIQHTVDWINSMSSSYHIIVVTARQPKRKRETLLALKEAGIKYNHLYMNIIGEGFGNGILSKKRIAEKLMNNGANIVLAIDNDAPARSAYSSVGIRSVSPENIPVSLSKAQDLWHGHF
jgi:hydroxymethylpyrimidine pyrophosphatase-like HAD family hydrolase